MNFTRRAVSRPNIAVLSLVAVMFVLVVVAYGIYPSYAQSQQTAQLNKTVSTKFGNDFGTAMRPILTIKVLDSNGTLAHKYVDPNDLITNQFISYWENFFLPVAGDHTASMVDSGGVSRNVYDRFSSEFSCADGPGCTASANAGAEIQVGTGSTPAARTDYILQTPVYTASQVGQSAYDPITGNVTVAASILATSGQTITESGMYVVWQDSTGTARTFLLFHDVFGGIVITNGQIVSIQYTFELLNTGFTNAWGTWLSFVLSSQLVGSSQPTFSATTTAGYVGSFQGFYRTSYGCAGCTSFQTSGTDNPFIEIGRGSTSPARSQTALLTSTCSTQVISAPTTTSTSTVVLQGSDTCATSQTIAEADLVILPLDSGSDFDPVMLWRTTFSGVPITGPGSIGVTFNLIFN